MLMLGHLLVLEKNYILWVHGFYGSAYSDINNASMGPLFLFFCHFTQKFRKKKSNK